MQSIEFDVRRGLLLAKNEGFMTDEEAESNGLRLIAAAKDARVRCGRMRLLVDSPLAQVQSSRITAIAAEIFQGLLEGPDDRIAVHVGSMLVKHQAQRILTDPRAKAFLSFEEALQWVLGD